jgi:hypothetical protein
MIVIVLSTLNDWPDLARCLTLQALFHEPLGPIF